MILARELTGFLRWRRIVCVGLVVFGLTPASALAAPQFVRVSWTDGANTDTTAAVTWNTTASGAASTVEYGTTAALGQSTDGVELGTGGPVGFVHSVSLVGLEPGTQYHYRVGAPGDWSPIHTFRTAPSSAAPGCEPIRFVAMGDGRSDDGYGPATHWKSILAEATGHSPDAIILTGDQVHDGDDHQQWLHWLQDSEGPITSVPIMPSLGNHDDDQTVGDSAIYNRVFSVPTNTTTQTEDYYFFTIGNAIFVSLSSQTFDGGATPMADQAAWLDQVLTDHPKTWKFVYFHHPVYTGVLGIPGLLELNHPPNEKNQNAALVPIFDKHHVDIVFAGHNHHYQRFEPMCCGQDEDQGNPTGDFETGTVYVVTGGAGALTYDLSFLGLDLPGLLCSPLLAPGSVQCDGRHHYVVVDIDGLELSYKVYSTASQLLSNDMSNIELIDEFTISKAGSPPQCAPPVPDDGPEPGPEPLEPVEAVAEAAAEVAPDAGPTDVPTDTDAETIAEPDAQDDITVAVDAAGEVAADIAAPDVTAKDAAAEVAKDGANGPADTGSTTGPEADAAGTGSEATGCQGAEHTSPWGALVPVMALGCWVTVRRRYRYRNAAVGGGADG